MTQPAEDADLPEKSVGAERRGELRADHLDGDLAAPDQVGRSVDPRHASPRHFALEAVAIPEVGLERHKVVLGHV